MRYLMNQSGLFPLSVSYFIFIAVLGNITASGGALIIEYHAL